MQADDTRIYLNRYTEINGRLDVDAIGDQAVEAAGVNHIKFTNTEINTNAYSLDTAQAGTLSYDANYHDTDEAGGSTINNQTYLQHNTIISQYNNTEDVGGLMFRDHNGWTMIPTSRTLKYLHTRLCSLGVGATPPGTEGELLVSGNVGI